MPEIGPRTLWCTLGAMRRMEAKAAVEQAM
jgi:hypothetical protein